MTSSKADSTLTSDAAVHAAEPLPPWLQSVFDSAAIAPATLVIGYAAAGADELALALAGKHAELPWPLPPALVSALVPPPKNDSRKEWYADKNADILTITPVRDLIPVDAVRRIIEFCALAPITLPRRIVVIWRAECMNRAAANALLKTLEEPSAGKSIILSARAAVLLPPTVASRCYIIHAPLPTRQQAETWVLSHGGSSRALDYCGGLPFAALLADDEKIAQAATLFGGGGQMDLLAAAKFCTDFGEDWLACLQKWVADGSRAACGLPARYFPGAEKKQVALCAQPRRWLDCHARLLRHRPLLSHPLARDLFIKEVLHDYQSMFAEERL